MPSRPFTLDRVVRLFITIASVAFALWLLYILRNVLLPFGVAVIIAYLCEPLVQFNRRLLHLRGRTVAVFVSLFGILFGGIVLGYLFVPSIINECRQVGALVSSYASTEQTIPFVPESVHHFIKEQIDFSRIGAWMAAADWHAIWNWSTSLLSSGFNFVLELFNWLLVLLYVVFIMLDYEQLGRGFRSLVPAPYRLRVFRVARDVKDSMNLYFRGQALVAFCVGILFAIGFLIMGLPLAVILGLFIGLLNMVPYLQLASIPVTALLCLVYSFQSASGFWLIFGEAMLVYCIVQGIQDLFLTPKIMGHVMGLNPAIILLSLSVWGSLLGLLGMIIALPLTTLLLSYYERYVLTRHSAKTLNKAITL